MRAVVIMLALALGAGTPSAAGPAAALPALPTPDWMSARFETLKAPVPPRRLVGGIHYVGTGGVGSFLITTPAGHILLDTGFADTVPHVIEGVELLGFKPADIKLILSSHAHAEHVGGHAEMKRLTGAQVVASAGDKPILESGGELDTDPSLRAVLRFERVRVDRTIADRGAVNLGGVTLTAVLTPGHTRGATTWTMEAVEDGKTHRVVFFSGMSVTPGMRLKLKPGYPDIAKDFEQAFVRLKSLSCDIFFAPHAEQWDMLKKFARLDNGEGVASLVDKAGWRALIGVAEFNYRKQLRAEEAAARAAK